MKTLSLRLLGWMALAVLLGGCATTRTLTIQTEPPADISIDGVAAGHGTVTRKITWKDKNQVHQVTASRQGYVTASIDLPADYKDKTLLLSLSEPSKTVTITIDPPALVGIDGQPAGDRPVDRITRQFSFSLGEDGQWTTHTIQATRPGFKAAKATIALDDNQTTYALKLEPMTKDLTIRTDPPGAAVTLDGKPVGHGPVHLKDVPFHMDLKTNRWIPQKVTITQPGYPPVTESINWDDGKTDYAFVLKPLSKTIHIKTDPPNARVTLPDGTVLKHDASGAAVATLDFPPVDAKGTLKTYDLTVVKTTAASQWYPQKLTIAWEDGRSDYSVNLKEILTRLVPTVVPTPHRDDHGWTILPKTLTTLAMKDVTEGPGRVPPTQLVSAGENQTIGSLAISPDGSTLLYSVIPGAVGGESVDAEHFHAQLRSLPTSGQGGESQLTDGKSLALMPTYSPDGGRILFSSNRAGRMSIWSMSATGQPGMAQLTLGDTTDLWPSIDAGPETRLYYERLSDTRPDPRIYMMRPGTTIRTDLSSLDGMQPRVSPKGDEILFTHVNPRTGNRDIYRMNVAGGVAENLTNTPDIDETDPAWNRDGTRIAYASNQGLTDQKQRQYDIWARDLSGNQRPMQLTTNGSLDDHPVWDPAGNTIYFRSNRGGHWGIWRLDISRKAASDQADTDQ